MRKVRVDLERLRGLLSAEQYEIAMRFIRPDGTLRASKPVVRMQGVEVVEDGFTHTRYEAVDRKQGVAAYAWRLVVFTVSDDRKHQCMPYTHEFGLPGRYGSEYYKLWQAIGDRIEKAVCDCIPKTEWAGVVRWGQAFGRIGTPEYTEEGAVVYRGIV